MDFSAVEQEKVACSGGNGAFQVPVGLTSALCTALGGLMRYADVRTSVEVFVGEDGVM